jgi:hypothetical protein
MAGGEKHIEALLWRAISPTLRSLIGRIGTIVGPRFTISAGDDVALMGILNPIAPFCCDYIIMPSTAMAHIPILPLEDVGVFRIHVVEQDQMNTPCSPSETCEKSLFPAGLVCDPKMLGGTVPL